VCIEEKGLIGVRGFNRFLCIVCIEEKGLIGVIGIYVSV
jgi:hypothetical protein